MYMKLPKIKILDEFNPILKEKSDIVTFPLSKEDKQLCLDLITYLKMSQDEEIAEKYDIRAGMGMAFIQLGIKKRIFVISYGDEDGVFEDHIIINPKILATSKELVYVGEGEGCLSIDREVEGIVPRHARITIEYQDLDGNKKEIRVREEISIAFQHEIDHLNGILFTDKIDPKDPFKNKDNMREI